MIEVRMSYLVKMTDAEGDLVDLWRRGRDTIWPQLDWNGRIQQMLHGHAQQSLFVWSSQWENVGAWEAAMARAKDHEGYQAWTEEMDKRRAYGPDVEIFNIFEPAPPPDTTPGRIEVRSAYVVPVERLSQAQEVFCRSLELGGWEGQNQQMLIGNPGQGLFVWSSTWNNLGEWEQAMGLGSDEFENWFADWVSVVDFGSTREIFRNQ